MRLCCNTKGTQTGCSGKPWLQNNLVGDMSHTVDLSGCTDCYQGALFTLGSLPEWCSLALTVPSSASALEALETQHLRSYIRHQTYTTQQMPWQPGNDKFLEQPVCQMLMAGKRSIQDTQSLLQPFAQAQMGGGMLRRVVLHEDHFGPRLLSSGTGWCSKCWGIIYIYILVCLKIYFSISLYTCLVHPLHKESHNLFSTKTQQSVHLKSPFIPKLLHQLQHQKLTRDRHCTILKDLSPQIDQVTLCLKPDWTTVELKTQRLTKQTTFLLIVIWRLLKLSLKHAFWLDSWTQ